MDTAWNAVSEYIAHFLQKYTTIPENDFSEVTKNITGGYNSRKNDFFQFFKMNKSFENSYAF